MKNLKLHLDNVHNEENRKQICTKCGKVLKNRESLRYHMLKGHNKVNTPDPDSNYEVVYGERANTKLYVKDGFLYILSCVRGKQAFLL